MIRPGKIFTYKINHINEVYVEVYPSATETYMLNLSFSNFGLPVVHGRILYKTKNLIMAASHVPSEVQAEIDRCAMAAYTSNNVSPLRYWAKRYE